MKINCVIIDDEPLSRKGLREYVADTAFLQLLGEYEGPMDAAEIISTGQVQLLLLDIQMPKITGIDFLKTLAHPPMVIFTTAYPQYAIDGFEMNAIDYLVKPVAFDRFLKAATKAKDYFELIQNRTDTTPAENKPGYFFIKSDNQLVKIGVDDIIFVEALQNYVAIQTTSKKYISYLTFKSVEDYLPGDKFIKVHKSYIISASKIDSIDGNDIRLGDFHIPISRNLKDEVMQQLLAGKFLKR